MNLREFATLTDDCVEAIARHCPQLKSVNFTCCHNLTRSSAVALALRCTQLTAVTFRGCGGWIDSFVEGLPNDPKFTLLSAQEL